MRAILITSDKEETRILNVCKVSDTIYTPGQLDRHNIMTNPNISEAVFPVIEYSLVVERPNGDRVYRRAR